MPPPGVSFDEAEVVGEKPVDVEIGNEIQGDVNPGGAGECPSLL